MANFFKDNLGYELADCICGERPELVSRRTIRSNYVYFDVRCPRCGRSSGLFVDEKDAVYYWNGHMKRRPEE